MTTLHPPQTRHTGLFAWWREGTPEGRQAVIAAGLGWMLDSFDVMLYALVLSALIPDLGMSKETAGLLGSVTLLAAAAGGIFFGVIADRFGRTRALMASVLIYSVFTAACGFAQTVTQLAIFRILLGIGMGGEWASGAALVSETWATEHRGKALGLMQSAWAIGYASAALVTMIVLPRWGWRVVFMVGILPAFLTLWVRARVEEPPIWRNAPPLRGSIGAHVQGWPGATHHSADSHERLHPLRLVGFQSLAAGLPLTAYDRRRHGVRARSTMSWFIIAMQVGMWFGYVTFGFISDAFGRKRTYIVYTSTAAVLILAYISIRDAAGAAPARAVRGVLRDRVLQRLRGGDCRDLPDRSEGVGAGIHLQYGPHHERACAVSWLARWHRSTDSRPPSR